MGRSPKQADRDSSRLQLGDIRRTMELARSGDSVSWTLIFQTVHQGKYKAEVEACRLDLCKKYRLRDDTSLSRLLGSLPTKPQTPPRLRDRAKRRPESAPQPAPQPAQFRGFRERAMVVRCTQCDHPAIPGDERCFLHIK